MQPGHVQGDEQVADAEQAEGAQPTRIDLRQDEGDIGERRPHLGGMLGVDLAAPQPVEATRDRDVVAPGLPEVVAHRDHIPGDVLRRLIPSVAVGLEIPDRPGRRLARVRLRDRGVVAHPGAEEVEHDELRRRARSASSRGPSPHREHDQRRRGGAKGEPRQQRGEVDHARRVRVRIRRGDGRPVATRTACAEMWWISSRASTNTTGMSSGMPSRSASRRGRTDSRRPLRTSSRPHPASNASAIMYHGISRLLWPVLKIGNRVTICRNGGIPTDTARPVKPNTAIATRSTLGRTRSATTDSSSGRLPRSTPGRG